MIVLTSVAVWDLVSHFGGGFGETVRINTSADLAITGIFTLREVEITTLHAVISIT